MGHHLSSDVLIQIFLLKLQNSGEKLIPRHTMSFCTVWLGLMPQTCCSQNMGQISKQVVKGAKIYLKHSICVFIQHELTDNEIGSTRLVRHLQRQVTLYTVSATFRQTVNHEKTRLPGAVFWISCFDIGWRNVFLKLRTTDNSIPGHYQLWRYSSKHYPKQRLLFHSMPCEGGRTGE